MLSRSIGTFIIQEKSVWLHSSLDIGALADHPNLKKNPNANVRTIADLLSLDDSVTEIIIDNGVGDWNFTVLDLSRFTRLRRLEIGDHCMSYVTTVNITGLAELESVTIGINSFTKSKNGVLILPYADRHFYLKDCPKLKSLKMGCFSFSDYTVIEIENVVALEVIEMGELNEECFNFHYASLELKSILIHNE